VSSNKDYLSINKASWNQRTEAHWDSDFYDVKGFINGESSLNDIEIGLLGNIKGKRILHLQCHFGQDSISLAKLGAQVTAMDLSDKAIERANELADKTGTEVNFICCDVYDLPNHLNEQFDIVYTSYGVIGWLPDLNKWSQIILSFLKPKGKFIMVEFHPVVWMFNDTFNNIDYNYFNSGAIIESKTGTYTDTKAEITNEIVTWNHSLSEVVNYLISKDLEINSLNEYDYSAYDCFNDMIEFEPKKYRIKHLDNKIPMMYSLVCTKK
jgi:SAM-dependent methyltransferase